MLGEEAKIQGFFGCFTVLFGAYLVSVDAQRKEKIKVQLSQDDIENQELKEHEPVTRKEKLKKLMISLKGPLFMTGVALSW